MKHSPMRRIPWWAWVLSAIGCLLVITISALVILRIEGLRALNQFDAELQATGKNLTLRQAAALLPDTDIIAQEKAWDLLNQVNWTTTLRVTHGLSPLYLTGRDQKLTAEDSARLVQNTAVVRQAWRDLYNQSPISLSALGWIRNDFPDLSISCEDSQHIRINRMPGLLSLAIAIATAARIDENPQKNLADLNALLIACEQPGSLLDGVILVSLRQTRDEAMLEALLRGIDVSAWIHEPIDTSAKLGDALSWDRLIFGDGMVASARSGVSPTFKSTPHVRLPDPAWWDFLLSPLGNLHWLGVGPGDVQNYHRIHILLEEQIRTGRRALFPHFNHGALDSFLYPLSFFSLPDLSEIGILVLESELKARRMRAAGAITLSMRRTGFLPLDATAADFPATALIAGTAVLPATRYRRINSHRFRLETDTAIPPDSLLDPSRITSKSVDHKIRWHHGRYDLELDLSGTPPQ